MHQNDPSGGSLSLFIVSWLSKIAAILTATILPNISLISNLICIGCAIAGTFFAWRNWVRNRKIDKRKDK
jgi:hypothetical protein